MSQDISALKHHLLDLFNFYSLFHKYELLKVLALPAAVFAFPHRALRSESHNPWRLRATRRTEKMSQVLDS